MSTLSLRKIKHDSSVVDNITLNSNGTTTANSEVIVPSLKGSTGNKLQLRSGDSSYGVSLQNVSGIDLLTVDAVGRVTMPYQPSFVTRRNSDIAVNPQNQTQINIYNVAIRNVGNHYNTSTGLFTAPVPGMYVFYAGVYMSIPFSQIWFVINGARSTSLTATSVSGENGVLHGSGMIYLTANDTIGVHAYSGSYSSATFYPNETHTGFTGHLIN